MMLLVKAIRSGNEEMYARFSDEQMLAYIKPYQLKSYIRRITRGVEVCIKMVRVLGLFLNSGLEANTL